MRGPDLSYLVKCALNNQVPNSVQLGDLSEIFSSAAKHKVSVMISYALKAVGIEDSHYLLERNIRRILLFETEWCTIKAEFEKQKIWYMPLKGMLLRECYPSPAMREFADYDILFDETRAEDVKRIMERAGFTCKNYGSRAHDVYYKAPVLIFEMHRVLFTSSVNNCFAAYYRNVKERLVSAGGYEYRFTSEDFYIFMIAHEYKHYSHSGTGLRSLIDTFVYLRKEKLDMDYVEQETGKLGIDNFERANRSLALHLFGGGDLTDEDREMLNDFLEGGAYGSIKTQLKNCDNSVLLYMLRRLSVPVRKKNEFYNDFAEKYPLFYQHRSLLPVLPFFRIFLSLRSGRIMGELKAIKDAKRNE